MLAALLLAAFLAIVFLPAQPARPATPTAGETETAEDSTVLASDMHPGPALPPP
jgi:hypothetical protein